MMFVVMVRLKGQPGKHKEILQTINGILDQLQMKNGCRDAVSYQETHDENIFFVVEEWQTEKDLDEYLHSTLFAALLGIESLLVEMPDIQIMHSSGSCHFEKNMQTGLLSNYSHKGAC